MTSRAVLGLLCLNLLYLAIGTSILWALNGWRSWSDLARLAGLAYLLGVAAFGVLWSLVLVFGLTLSGSTLLATGGAVLLAALVVGARRHGPRRRPVRPAWPRLSLLSVVSAGGIALTVVFLEFLFRAGRLQGLYAFDAWAFWVPKAKVLYEFGTLDVQFFAQLPGPTYPPLAPFLDAAAFHAMGSADVVTLHLQYWLLTVGFVAAVAGILSTRVPSWILWPFVLLVLVLPRVTENPLAPQADFLLQFFFGAAVLLAAVWLVERTSWPLVAAGVLLAGGILTKREGTLLAACLVVSLLVATFDRKRVAWPRLGVLAGALLAVGVPWRAWYRANGIGGELPGELDLGGRAGQAVRLSLEVLADPALFLVMAPLGLTAVLVAATWGSRRLALLFGVLVMLLVLGGAWITTAYPELPITADEAVNPIVRYTVAPVLVLGVAAPLLLASVWSSGRRAAQ